MSDENVAIVRAAISAFENQDQEAARDLFWPDVVMSPPDGWPDGQAEHGRDAVFGQFVRLAEGWRRNEMNVEDIVTGEDAVVVRLRWRTTGEASRIAVELELSGAYFFRDGRISEMRFFRDHDAALDAAGLRR